MAEHPTRQLAVILHADVVGSTALVQRDETLAHTRIQDVFHRFSETIDLYGGATTELRGDALVAEFSRASDAVCAAVAFQDENTTFNASLEDDLQPRLRVGIAIGEVVIADNTITGDGVVLAQRLEQLAKPGGVCIQGAAYETVPKRLPFAYESLGEQTLKGFDEPVRAYGIRLTAEAVVPQPESRQSKTPALELPDKPSIAVLPFTNMSGDPEQEYFSDGVTEDIITELSRFRDMFVIARNSSFTYKNKAVKVQEVAADLGVRYVVEGSVRTAGKRIRVTAQLIDAVTGHHMWAERFDRELTDVFLVQDEITQTVTSTVAGRVKATAEDSAARKRIQDVDSYDYVLRGQGIVADSEQKNLQARRAYEKALELNPKCARAYAGLAMCGLVSIANHWEESDEYVIDRGLECASKAVGLDQSDSKSQYLLAHFLYLKGRLDEAKIHIELAVSLNPNDADALASMGVHLHGRGAPQEAIDCYLKAIRLNPYHPVWYLWHLGLAYYSSKRYGEALVPLQEAISQHPAFPFPRKVLAATLAQLNRIEEARIVVEGILTDQPDASIKQGDVYVLGAATRSQDWSVHWLQGLRKAGLPE
ncbi:MAG: adenylate/guanylate cyclase domain-containing protein [Gemmatimonadales bacterium]